MFVKGNEMFPQCGFSKAVMDIFGQYDVAFETRDVLDDPDLRDGIKKYSNWPTIPQVYVNGKFLGGCDIIVEMHNKGELGPLLGKDKKAN